MLIDIPGLFQMLPTLGREAGTARMTNVRREALSLCPIKLSTATMSTADMSVALSRCCLSSVLACVAYDNHDDHGGHAQRCWLRQHTLHTGGQPDMG